MINYSKAKEQLAEIAAGIKAAEKRLAIAAKQFMTEHAKHLHD